MKKAKHKYETEISKNAKSNPKLFYSYLSKKKQNKIQVGPIRLENGNLCSSDTEMAEALNQQYASVFTKDDWKPIPDPPKVKCPQMAEIIITPHEVSEVLKNMKNGSSPGPNGIGQRVKKEAHEELCQS